MKDVRHARAHDLPPHPENGLSKPKPHPVQSDGSPVGEPRTLFTAAAIRVGLIQPGPMLTEDLVDFAVEIVTLAACIADRYPSPSCEADTVGDDIRAQLFEM